MNASVPAISDVPGLLDEVRNRFAHVDECPFQGPRVFFENAGGALTLNSVVETTTRFASIPDNQGRDNEASRALMDIIATSKDDVALFFNAQGGKAFVGESGTELLFRIVSACVMASREGGIVLGSTLEHPATRSACNRWAGIADKPYVQVPHNPETGTVTVTDYAELVNDSVRVATIIHTSPVTGMGVDVAAIAATIREKSPDAFIIVDGIQHASHGNIDLTEADVDAYVISPYKVFSRHGYGIAWISDRLVDQPLNSLQDGPLDGWEMGTRDTGAYATFSDVVAYFEWLGGEVTKTIVSDADSSKNRVRRKRIEAAAASIHAHEKKLTHAMLHGTGNQKGLADMAQISIIGGIDNPAREGLVSIVVDGMESGAVVARLNEAGIRVHIRKADHYSGNVLEPLGLESCVRVSMCHYNSEQEVAQFLATMAEILEC